MPPLLKTREEHVENTVVSGHVLDGSGQKHPRLRHQTPKVPLNQPHSGLTFGVAAIKSASSQVEMSLRMSNVTYGRGQAEWALWKSFTFGRSTSGEVPKVFKTRVKRLLDVDRDSDFADVSAPPPGRWSFVAPPEEAGGEAAYSEVDVFCLAVGLDLMDAGFKQSEVVFLVRYLRPELEARMTGLVQRPSLLSRQNYRPDSSLPMQTKNGKALADARHFVIISKIEIRDNLLTAKASDHKAPLFLEPDYCDGVERLGAVLGDAMPNRRRVVTVVELTATAQAVAEYLPKAPSIRRGRPKA